MTLNAAADYDDDDETDVRVVSFVHVECISHHGDTPLESGGWGRRECKCATWNKSGRRRNISKCLFSSPGGIWLSSPCTARCYWIFIHSQIGRTLVTVVNRLYTSKVLYRHELSHERQTYDDDLNHTGLWVVGGCFCFREHARGFLSLDEYSTVK